MTIKCSEFLSDISISGINEEIVDILRRSAEGDFVSVGGIKPGQEVAVRGNINMLLSGAILQDPDLATCNEVSEAFWTAFEASSTETTLVKQGELDEKGVMAIQSRTLRTNPKLIVNRIAGTTPCVSVGESGTTVYEFVVE